MVNNLSVGDGVSGFGVTDLLADEADQEYDDKGGDGHTTVVIKKILTIKLGGD